ncbi:MAG: dethiobiotin synthase [Desulfobulbaceae bacterium A2]|nr:MAG: dethiobiotin synthase [Desulfobulbaceae bacterium A2]
MKILAVCGIDTGVGKSVVTGLLARWLIDRGERVITMKLVQTGGSGRSEDILLHRRLMGVPWNHWDDSGLTCPYRFPLPASPHLAARLAGQRVQPERLDQSLAQLADAHDRVLIEGAGGLLVPLTEDLLLADFLAARALPILLVTSSRLGSINHTLLSLEAIRARGLVLAGLLCNTFPPALAEIEADSPRLFRAWLDRLGLACPLITLGQDHAGSPACDFSPLFPPLSPT